MRLSLSFYTFLMFNLRLCYSNMTEFYHSNKNSDNRNFQRELEYMKQLQKIKQQIMLRLNISSTTTSKPEPDVVSRDYEYSGANILSYSEPADNFTDENIVQFRIGNVTSTGPRVYVNSANLVVRVKYKRRKKKNNNAPRSKRNIPKDKSKKKNRKFKPVNLNLYTVNQNGEPGEVITSVSSALKKTKWLKLSVPRNVVQHAIDSKKHTLQVYITCKGCGKRAKVILVHKNRKRKRRRKQPKRDLKLKLHKRRPYLLMHVMQMKSKA